MSHFSMNESSSDIVRELGNGRVEIASDNPSMIPSKWSVQTDCASLVNVEIKMIDVIQLYRSDDARRLAPVLFVSFKTTAMAAAQQSFTSMLSSLFISSTDGRSLQGTPSYRTFAYSSDERAQQAYDELSKIVSK